MAKVARENKLTTQMGTQGMASDGSRAGIEVIRSGVLEKSPSCTSEPIGRRAGGRKALTGRRTGPLLEAAWTGTSGWACAARPYHPAIAPSSGGDGKTSALALWATWPSATRPCPSPRWTSVVRFTNNVAVTVDFL